VLTARTASTGFAKTKFAYVRRACTLVLNAILSGAPCDVPITDTVMIPRMGIASVTRAGLASRANVLNVQITAMTEGNARAMESASAMMGMRVPVVKLSCVQTTAPCEGNAWMASVDVQRDSRALTAAHESAPISVPNMEDALKERVDALMASEDLIAPFQTARTPAHIMGSAREIRATATLATLVMTARDVCVRTTARATVFARISLAYALLITPDSTVLYGRAFTTAVDMDIARMELVSVLVATRVMIVPCVLAWQIAAAMDSASTVLANALLDGKMWTAILKLFVRTIALVTDVARTKLASAMRLGWVMIVR